MVTTGCVDLLLLHGACRTTTRTRDLLDGSYLEFLRGLIVSYFSRQDWNFPGIFLFLQRQTGEETDSRTGYSGWIPCNAILRCLTKPIKLKWVGQYYKLEKALNDHVEEHHGDISY